MTALLAIGLVTGVASGLLGVGGGFILVPLLSLLGVSLHQAVGASLVYVFFASVSGALRHLAQGTADWHLALPLMLASMVTAAVGSVASVGLPEQSLSLVFAVATGVALLLFNLRAASPGPKSRPPRPGRWWIARRRTAGGQTYDYGFSIVGAAGTGALIGLVTGLLGIGGGFLLVPMLVGLLRVPLAIAIGSSLLSILAAASTGIAAHWSLLGLDLPLVLPLVVAGVLGAQVGARLVVWLRPRWLRLAYNALLVLATLYMVARAAGAAGGPA